MPSDDDDAHSAAEKRQLLAELLKKKRGVGAGSPGQQADPGPTVNPSLSEGMAELRRQKEWLTDTGGENPFFRSIDGSALPTTRIDGRKVINYGSYNYLGLSGHARVNRAAQEAIEELGTSVGASRIASGERELHRRLEAKMASLFGVEDALVFVGGYGTNETAIGHLVGTHDLIVHDSLLHRSGIDGALLSGARRMPFPHNDLDALERILVEQRGAFRQCLVVVEGLYSMDGDTALIPRLVELKKDHDAMLFIDEAHSMGVVGSTGRGVAEHYGVAPEDVDFWMTTLSKTFASCGGVVAASAEVIDYLRYTTPGFLYSVGMSPPNAAAALEAGLDTGHCEGFAVIPVITRSSEKALRMSNQLFVQGINVQPVLHPAVAESESRLRFFITSEHSSEQIDTTVEALARTAAEC